MRNSSSFVYYRNGRVAEMKVGGGVISEGFANTIQEIGATIKQYTSEKNFKSKKQQ